MVAGYEDFDSDENIEDVANDHPEVRKEKSINMLSLSEYPSR